MATRGKAKASEGSKKGRGQTADRPATLREVKALVEKLGEKMDARFEATEAKLGEQRSWTEAQFREERSWTEAQFREHRSWTVAQFGEQRSWTEAQFREHRSWTVAQFGEQRSWTEAQFGEQRKLGQDLKEWVQDQYRYLGAVLEDIRSQNRAVIEAVQGERQGRQGELRSLRDDVYPRLEAVETVVREHGARFDTKADKSLEARVEALERRSR